MNEQEKNFVINGDQARMMMAALATSNASLPAREVVAMYLRLAQISEVQPKSNE